MYLFLLFLMFSCLFLVLICAIAILHLINTLSGIVSLFVMIADSRRINPGHRQGDVSKSDL